jgi:Na+-transporting NADH:ubiquinone oxidoreductase subunit NqrF
LLVAALEGGARMGSARDAARADLLASGQEAALANWLGERIAEVRKLEATVSELLVHPGGINHERFERRDLVEHTFRDINSEVLRRLQREAPEWVDYYVSGPAWYNPAVSQVGDEAFRQLIRLLAYTAGQLAHVKEQVSE